MQPLLNFPRPPVCPLRPLPPPQHHRARCVQDTPELIDQVVALAPDPDPECSSIHDAMPTAILVPKSEGDQDAEEDEPTTPTLYLPPTPLKQSSLLFPEDDWDGEGRTCPTPHSTVHFNDSLQFPRSPVSDTPPRPDVLAPAVKARSIRYAVLQYMHQCHDKPWLWGAWLCVGSPF